jgi:hypothetical protein
MKRPARIPSQLSPSIHNLLSMYTLAASAAGVGVLALVQPTEAKIVYTPTHKTIKVHQHYNLDLNHDAVTDFTLQLKTFHTRGTSAFSTLTVVFPKHNAVEGAKTTSSSGRGPYAFALQRGALIGPKQPFPANLMALAGTIDGFSVDAGQWLNAKNRYLGLKFQIHGTTHFGWARLTVVSAKISITSATLTGYAYETIPNKPIIAGKTHGGNEPTLGRLAQGASGVSIGGKP